MLQFHFALSLRIESSTQRQLLLKLASNILREPENEKYHRFKPTNTQVRKNIVDVKGGLEYAVEVRGLIISPFVRGVPL
jgi:hypothetical protein